MKKDHTQLVNFCLICGKEIRNVKNLYPCLFKNKRYCSDNCRHTKLSSEKSGDKNPSRRDEVKQKISQTLTEGYRSGRIKPTTKSEEGIRTISLSKLGKKNPNYQGKSVVKIKATNAKKSEEDKLLRIQRLKEARRGKISTLSKESNPQWYENIKAAAKNSERRTKIRIARIKYLEAQLQKSGKRFTPGYSSQAVSFFEKIDKEFDTVGIYALHPGEYRTKSYYFLDYINFDKKIIIEWDERQHYDRYFQLREKDINRQSEIQQEFLDFQILRLKPFLHSEEQMIDQVRQVFN